LTISGDKSLALSVIILTGITVNNLRGDYLYDILVCANTRHRVYGWYLLGFAVPIVTPQLA